MFISRCSRRVRRPHRTRLCAELAILLVLTNQAVSAWPAVVSQPATSSKRSSEALLDIAPVAALNADLQTAGYRITPLLIGAGGETPGLHVALLAIEPTQPHPEVATQGDAWDSSIPLAVAAVTSDHGIVATVETRLRAGAGGGVQFLHEVRPVAAPDVRVRVTSALNQGASSHTVQILGRQANGLFAEVLKDGQGQARFADGELFARGDFSDCVDDCFNQVNNPIGWAEMLCIGVCLVAGGIAAAATGGAGVAPVLITCIDICGISFVVANIAALAGCVIQCL